MADINTWAWIGGTSNLITASMTGTTVPLANYETDVVFNDTDDNGFIRDLDGTGIPPLADEGITINGTFYQFEQFTAWTATIVTSDSTTFTVNMHVARLDDDTLYFRLNDSALTTLIDAGYYLNDLSSITLNTLNSGPGFENLGITNNNRPFPVCFCAGTLITTSTAELAVERLTAGDLIYTKEQGLQPLCLVLKSTYSSQQFSDWHRFLPVVIPQGSLGPGLPAADMMVSPQHRILLNARPVFHMEGVPEVFVPAKKLIGYNGIHLFSQAKTITYYHLVLDRHHAILSNGIYTESFFVSPLSLGALNAAARAKIEAHLCRAGASRKSMTLALPVLKKGARIQQLLKRCQKNAHSAVQRTDRVSTST